MKNLYAVVVNERNDPTIAEAVRKLLPFKESTVPLERFRSNLCVNLQLSSPIELVRVESTGVARVENGYSGRVYRVIDDIVYKTEPKKT